LPEIADADEFYHADLIGLDVVDRAGALIGTVIAIHNFGAGDLIEVRAAAIGKTELVPFDADHVPAVEIAAGRIVIEPHGVLLTAGRTAPSAREPRRGAACDERE
jgi:16S rRNA processing protein RimM